MASHIPEQIIRRWEYYKKLGKLPEAEAEFLEKTVSVPQEEVKDSSVETAHNDEPTVSVQETPVQNTEAPALDVQEMDVNAEAPAPDVQEMDVNTVEQQPEPPKVEDKPKRRRRKTNPDGSVEDADGDGVPDSQEQ